MIQNTIHPDTNKLSDFAKGNMSETACVEIENHINECEHCRQRLEQISSDQDEFMSQIRDAIQAPRLSESSADVESNPVSRIIGPYKLLQRIGSGGMGEVWMAEQEKPVRHRVALKADPRGGQFQGSHSAVRSRTASIVDDGPSKYRKGS